jgi:hypothetical protein
MNDERWSAGHLPKLDRDFCGRVLEQGVEQRLHRAGVPEANVAAETARLLEPLQAIRQRLDRPNPTLAEARGIKTAVTEAALTLQQQLQSVGQRYEIRRRLDDLEQGVEKRVRDTSVPEDKVDAEVQSLAAQFDALHEQFTRQDLGFYDVQSLRSRLERAEQAVQQRIKELRAIYQVDRRPEVRLRLSDLVRGKRVASIDELEQVLSELRLQILAQLEREQTIVFE